MKNHVLSTVLILCSNIGIAQNVRINADGIYLDESIYADGTNRELGIVPDNEGANLAATTAKRNVSKTVAPDAFVRSLGTQLGFRTFVTAAPRYSFFQSKKGVVSNISSINSIGGYPGLRIANPFSILHKSLAEQGLLSGGELAGGLLGIGVKNCADVHQFKNFRNLRVTDGPTVGTLWRYPHTVFRRYFNESLWSFKETHCILFSALTKDTAGVYINDVGGNRDLNKIVDRVAGNFGTGSATPDSKLQANSVLRTGMAFRTVSGLTYNNSINANTVNIPSGTTNVDRTLISPIAQSHAERRFVIGGTGNLGWGDSTGGVGVTYFNTGSRTFTTATTAGPPGTGQLHTFTVPPGVNVIRVQIVGGGGGGGFGDFGETSGACAGLVIGELAVVPGEDLKVFVGAGGLGYDSGTNAGLGGTGSYIQRGTTILAGAGGGGGGSSNGFADGYQGGCSYGTNFNGANGSSSDGGLGGQNYIAYLRGGIAFVGARSVSGTTGPATGVTSRFFTSFFNSEIAFGFGGRFGNGSPGVVIIHW